MSDGAILERHAGEAVWLTLSRPAKANAYTEPMLTALEAAIERAERSRDVRVIVVTGDGDGAFCAGADRAELANRDWRDVANLPAARVFARLQSSPLVSIAAINGAAVGGGFELALHCDLRIASDRASFWLPEPEFGLLPAAGGVRLLPRLVGALRANDVILGGARWSAEDAWRAGLISEVASHPALATTVEAWLRRIVARDASALTWAKRLMAPAGDHGLDRQAQSALVKEQRQGRRPSPASLPRSDRQDS
jgi:enoyl-CoA hydratase/carnithine racemase